MADFEHIIGVYRIKNTNRILENTNKKKKNKQTNKNKKKKKRKKKEKKRKEKTKQKTLRDDNWILLAHRP